MSTQPRPRPRPRPKPKAPAAAGASSQDASCSGTNRPAKKSGLEFFMMTTKKDNFASRQADFEQQEKAAAKLAPEVTTIESDEEDDSTPHDNKRKNRTDDGFAHPKIKPMPSWTQDMSKIRAERRSESVVDTVEILDIADTSEEDLSPRSKRARKATKASERGRKIQRNRNESSSPSSSPTPELTREEKAAMHQVFRTQFPAPAVPRDLSPGPSCDTSFDSISGLNPELQERARKIKLAPKPAQSGPSGRPEQVIIKVTWVRHPQDTLNAGTPAKTWTYRMKRDQNLKVVFQSVAAATDHPVGRIKLCFDGDEVFKLVTLDSFPDIWDHAEFEAYLDTTLTYIRSHRTDSPSKNRQSATSQALTARPKDDDGDKDNVSDSEEERVADDKLKLSLQGAGGNKKISAMARKATTAMALIKHYLKSLNMEFSDQEIKSKRIRMQFDGEDVDYDQTVGDIADGELEGGECLDIVGLS